MMYLCISPPTLPDKPLLAAVHMSGGGGNVEFGKSDELKAEVQPLTQPGRIKVRDAGKRKPRVYDDEYDDRDHRRVKQKPAHEEIPAAKSSSTPGRGRSQVLHRVLSISLQGLWSHVLSRVLIACPSLSDWIS
jgi:hypothetical protein